jgi:uncharacterized lipoprotein YmbA
MKWLILITALLLIGCGQSAGEKAESEYRLAQTASLSADEKCAAERKIQQAYLQDGKGKEYRDWRISASIACNQADIERLM